MKNGLIIITLIVIVLIGAAFIYDALNSKPQREILIDKNYQETQAESAAAPNTDDKFLTPMPGP